MIAVLASGSGSNFEVLAQNLPSKITMLVCNVEGAAVIDKANKYNISTTVVPHQNFVSRAAHEEKIVQILQEYPDLKLIVLAGYMRVLSPAFFKFHDFWKNKTIVNLHPAHLDEYKGAHAYAHAVNNKYPRWGVSIHEVTEELDSGTLISSQEFPVLPYETISELQNRAKTIEHNLLLSTVKQLVKKTEEHNVKQNL